MELDRRKHFRVFFLVILALSLVSNVVLLRSSNLFNLDSLKWAIKSQFVNFQEFRDGRIPLLKSSKGRIDYSNFLSSGQDDRQIELIKSIGSNFSIFGLGDGAGYSGLPKGLPDEIAKCAVKLGLNANLYFTDTGRFRGETAYVFFQSDLSTISLVGSLLSGEKCDVKGRYRLQKSGTSWMLSEKINFDLSANQLPARFALRPDNSLVIVTRLGEICQVTSSSAMNPKLACEKTSIDFTKSKKNTNHGVKSILLSGKKLFVAYAVNDSNCNRLEIKRIALSSDYSTEISHQNIYRSPGCLNSETTNLNGIGGRMIFSNREKTEITFSLGNAEIWTGLEVIKPQQEYGTLLKLDLKSKSISTISTGHRNPQGLCLMGGQLFSSEQGPDGGDELNQIKVGKDYGWPLESYGMPYGEFAPRGAKSPAFSSHKNSEKPLLSWVPAIAAGDLLCPNNAMRGAWSRSFLLATLKDSSIRRIVLDGGSIRVDERIPMGTRIRDISVNNNGQLVALTDEGSLIQIKLIDR
jgi:glucose/arabinose dehydrogenase